MKQPTTGTMYRVTKNNEVVAVTGHDFENGILLEDSYGKRYRFNLPNLEKAITDGHLVETEPS